MDEELISEVQQHSVIYNRQKYFMNSVGQEKYESKDDAWREISMKIGTDVESCKKRWKYLRERYVQTRKQGDPPTYEHLSRPYLEKMNFLDQHIQPRKSYRNASSFLPSPNATFGEYMDSRSNGSIPKMIYPNYPDSVSIKSEPEPFQNFASVNCPPQHTSQQLPVAPQPVVAPLVPLIPQQHPPMQQYQPMHSGHGTEFRENDITHIPSSSSSMKSPLSSPQTADQHENSDSIKRPRLPPSRHHPNVEDDDSSDTEEAQQQHQREQLMNEARRKSGRQAAPSYPNNNDFLYSVYQRFAPPNASRSSEQLLGELVTSELLKMNRERRKVAQRRILEVLFFED